MFKDLHKTTVELLANKAENFLFKDKENLEREIASNNEYSNGNLTSFNVDDFMKICRFSYEQEQTTNKIVDDERVLALKKCMQRWKILEEQQAACTSSIKELCEKYNSVSEKTSSLHNACDQMMSQQTQLAAGNEQIKSKLHYYQQYEWLMKKLQTSKLSLTGSLFTQILSTIHECLTYLKNNREEKEAEIYLQKYEQCLSKSLTAIKIGVLADLETCRDEVSYRQSQVLLQTNQAMANAHRMSGDERNSVLSYVDDDTFALLYGVFGVKASTVRNAIAQAHNFFADYVEYQTVVLECEHEYFQIRENLLRPIVTATIEHLRRQHNQSSCTLARDGCSFLLRLCDDEFRLYKQFFVITPDGGATSRGSRATPQSQKMAAMSADVEYFWRQSSMLFDAFIEGLCRILYDTLRPLIISNQHLETLAQICTLLRVEMIEERCGVIVSPTLFNNSITNQNSLPNSANVNQQQNFDYSLSNLTVNPRGGFARVMSELVGDIVERIVYRAGLFAQSDILGYNPAVGDLSYPERLIMMKNINSDANKANISNSTGESVKSEEDALKNFNNKFQAVSAVDLHCLWYPTVQRTVLRLNNLYKCLDIAVFLSISRELLDACCKSLELAADKIRNLPIDSAKASIKGSGRGLDAELFTIKHLLILREQTRPYWMSQKSTKGGRAAMTSRSDSINSISSRSTEPFSQFDYAIDFGKYKSSMFQLLNPENRSRWFELSSNNAFLSFLISAPVNVSEHIIDSRRIIEGHLKKHCYNLIQCVTNILVGQLVNLSSKINEFEKQHELQQKQQNDVAKMDLQKSQYLSAKNLNDTVSYAFKNLKQNWPAVQASFSLYIGFGETEEILLQPVRKNIVNLFTNVNLFVQKYYNEEEKQIASIPNQELIWLLLNSNSTQQQQQQK